MTDAPLKLSVIVVMHNMRREAERTLHSLTPAYQRGAREDEFEVIVIDSGSSEPLDSDWVCAFGANFRHYVIQPEHPTPIEALQWGVDKASAPNLAFAIDGARIVSPGCIRAALEVLACQPASFVYTLGFHLGAQSQQLASTTGYDQAAEDQLLGTVDWRKNGYALFNICCLAGSSNQGYLGPIAESNFFAIAKNQFLKLGGFDSRFISPGGGYVNLDFFHRALGSANLYPVLLLGEGTFHQYHGGVASNEPPSSERHNRFRQEYESIRGERFRRPDRRPCYYGVVPQHCQRFL